MFAVFILKNSPNVNKTYGVQHATLTSFSKFMAQFL